MDRRTLLRLLAVAGSGGLAGCGPTTDEAGRGADAGPSDPPDATVGAPGADGVEAAPSPTTSPSPDDAAVATPEPSPSPTPAPTPHTRTYVTRDDLGLAAPLPGGAPHTITGLMLHHTAVSGADPAGAGDRFRSFDRHHRESGFVDVAYHWGVTQDGTVLQLRDEAVAGETFTSYDPAGWFLVVCDGNFEVEAPTDALLDAVVDVFAAGAQRHGVDPATLLGHRDRAATACPGDGLQALLPTLRDRIAATLAAGGVTLVAG